MPIDNREKRASAGMVGALALSFPVPDTAINAGDRKQTAALYRIPESGGGGTAVIMRTWKIAYPS